MTRTLDITAEQRKTLLSLLRQFIPGVLVWAYGSRVKWTARPNSDLDLVVFVTARQREQVSELKDVLAESNFPFLVDIHIWDEVPNRFHEIIRKDYVVLQAAEEKRLSGDTAGGFTTCTLDELADFRNGKSISPSSYTPTGKHPVFGSNGQIARTNALLNPQPVVVIGRVGAYCGSVYGVHEPSWVTDNAIIAEPKPDVDFRFLYYRLKSLDLNRTAIGSAQPLMTQGGLKMVTTVKPPLPEQQAIARVLGALDDKIELNQRMNETQEALARTLFQRMRDESAGTKGKLCDCCERIENGGTPKRGEPRYWEPATVPWLTSGEVRQPIVTKTENMISEEGLANSSAKLWPAATTVVALYGATAGQVCFLGDAMCANQACCGLIPKKDMRYFVYLHMSSSVAALEQQARGSAQQNLSQQIVADFPVTIPSPDTLAKFDEAVHPLFTRWIANIEESRTLAALRDALLPKLLSGAVRVKGTAS